MHGLIGMVNPYDEQPITRIPSKETMSSEHSSHEQQSLRWATRRNLHGGIDGAPDPNAYMLASSLLNNFPQDRKSASSSTEQICFPVTSGERPAGLQPPVVAPSQTKGQTVSVELPLQQTRERATPVKKNKPEDAKNIKSWLNSLSFNPFASTPPPPVEPVKPKKTSNIQGQPVERMMAPGILPPSNLQQSMGHLDAGGQKTVIEAFQQGPIKLPVGVVYPPAGSMGQRNNSAAELYTANHPNMGGVNRPMMQNYKSYQQLPNPTAINLPESNWHEMPGYLNPMIPQGSNASALPINSPPYHPAFNYSGANAVVEPVRHNVPIQSKGRSNNCKFFYNYYDAEDYSNAINQRQMTNMTAARQTTQQRISSEEKPRNQQRTSPTMGETRRNGSSISSLASSTRSNGRLNPQRSAISSSRVGETVNSFANKQSDNSTSSMESGVSYGTRSVDSRNSASTGTSKFSSSARQSTASSSKSSVRRVGKNGEPHLTASERSARTREAILKKKEAEESERKAGQKRLGQMSSKRSAGGPRMNKSGSTIGERKSSLANGRSVLSGGTRNSESYEDLRHVREASATLNRKLSHREVPLSRSMNKPHMQLPTKLTQDNSVGGMFIVSREVGHDRSKAGDIGLQQPRATPNAQLSVIPFLGDNHEINIQALASSSRRLASGQDYIDITDTPKEGRCCINPKYLTALKNQFEPQQTSQFAPIKLG